MPCIESGADRAIRESAGSAPPQPRKPARALLALACTAALSGCVVPPGPPEPPAPVTSARPRPVDPPAQPDSRGAPSAAVSSGLPAPGRVRDFDELRLQAAHRIVAANPHITYLDTVPQVLLAIPVLEVDLNADGTIRKVEVLRHPRQAKDTTQIAIDAVRRAAPFGDVSKLKRPWRFTETFLFNDDRKFKPRTLNER